VPDLMIMKSSQVVSDPVNTSNPKRIPGARILYTVQVTNMGPGRPDAGSLRLRDVLPDALQLGVASGAGEVSFSDPAGDSGVTFDLATDVGYSSETDGGEPFDHPPTDDGSGVDPSIRGIEVIPGGRLSGFDGVGSPPMFRIVYEVILE